jgi:cell wall-associated NlpC family hydrolase
MNPVATDAAGIAAQRAHVVREARRWIGTPYHDQGDVLGAGVDCGMIGVRVFVDFGLVAPFDPRPYPRDWMMHRDDERFLDIVRTIASREYDPDATPPQAGDFVVWRHGKTFSHGAIVTGEPRSLVPTGWPWVVHALVDAGRVIEEDVSRSTAAMRLGARPRPMRAFSLWPEAV